MTPEQKLKRIKELQEEIEECRRIYGAAIERDKHNILNSNNEGYRAAYGQTLRIDDLNYKKAMKQIKKEIAKL